MPTGKTKDAGWQIGVSRTVAHPIGAVWDLLTRDEGVGIWLGPGARLEAGRAAGYETDDGTRGEVRSYRRNDRVRLTWQPADWDHDSTIQVAVQDKGERTLIRFHQERLADAAEREQQRRHWSTILDRLEQALEGG